MILKERQVIRLIFKSLRKNSIFYGSIFKKEFTIKYNKHESLYLIESFAVHSYYNPAELSCLLLLACKSDFILEGKDGKVTTKETIIRRIENE